MSRQSTCRRIGGLALAFLIAVALGVTSAIALPDTSHGRAHAADQTELAYDYDLAGSATTLTANSRIVAPGGRPLPRTSPGIVRGASGFVLATKAERGLPWAGHRPYAPNRDLPRYPGGRPKPESPYPHTQLGTRKGRYPQSREFDENGRPVRDIDWTDHGNPDVHTDPQQHEYGSDGSRGGPGSAWP